MRHGKKFNHLSRKSAHRKSMLANMACSLIEHKRIRTTLAKAKALRVYIEPLITKSKNDTTHSRRIVFSYLKQKEAVTDLFGEIATKVADRPGGYIRILKLGNRLGDNAQMAYVEFVDYNEDYITDKPKRKKSRRARKKSSDAAVSNIKEEKVEEISESEAPSAEESPESEAPSAEESPESEAPSAEESPESEAPSAEESPESEAPSAEESPESEAPSAEESPESEAPSAEESPESEAPSAEESPESEAPSAEESPESKSPSVDEELEDSNPETKEK